ncbi:hypothetical protein ACQKK2_20280 [Bacillus paranthracis]|uniref:Uncharacterized protein n=1 Tax=Bacillus cereus (strain Q1) TaxID=361100 RepID=B9IT62_BACCQ|nr:MULTISPECIES: hypothetical protein [Bacillus cereus group]ACM11544.1 hypothetical protein BCQ_1114 [Bacillus cereus Q1]MBY5227749.1 hypothetical protein [Bacillus paranthracis]MCY9249954.1 hypothetical protein [Bacillus paranthracis]MDA1499055.1 hypothetical protein [Bacillus cereus group sp. TH41-1LC]MDA1685219.1 hypothetical protein [Bacillus cereus group sp. m2-21]
MGDFGEFKIAKLNQTAVSDVDQLVLEELYSLRREINSVKREVTDEDFLDYLNINDVDIYSMPVSNVLTIIANAQSDLKKS